MVRQDWMSATIIVYKFYITGKMGKYNNNNIFIHSL